jgi:hypothetical protein
LGISAADGVSADLAGLQQLVAAVRDRTDDLRKIVRGLQTLPPPDEHSFDRASGAYQAFLESWIDELRINAGALDELGCRFAAAADAYQQTDVHWSISLQQAAAPPDPNTLFNPAPPPSVPPPTQPGVTGPTQPGVTTK